MKDFLKFFLGVARGPFLLLAVSCGFLGLGIAIWTGGRGSVSVLSVILIFIGSLTSHISVNAFNEYYDFRTSLDSHTQRTPFSGGSGTLQAHPELAPRGLAVAVISFLVTAGIGIYFLFTSGIWLLPLGLVGLVVIYTYTIWLVRSPILCLLAPGIGFGPLMVMGSAFALSGQYSWTALIASFVPFFLVSDLLLLNQFPDVEPDRSVGRLHFPITIGRQKSASIYGLFLLGAYLAILVGVITRYLPFAALLGLGTLPLAFKAYQGAVHNAEEPGKLIPSLGLNVIINLVTPVLVGVGLLIG